MTENKANGEDETSGSTTVRISIALDDKLRDEIEKYPRRQQPSKGKLLADAWELTRPLAQKPNTPETLTEDQRDVLAMLSEPPERDFLFSSLQTTVRHALEQYRRKWKQQTPKEETPGKSREPHRRSSGTR